MSVYNTSGSPLPPPPPAVESAKEFDGPQPSRYVPSLDAADNRIAATPSLYGSSEHIARSAQPQPQPPPQQQGGYVAAGPRPYQNSSYSNVGGGPVAAPAIPLMRPSPNASYSSNSGGGMSQQLQQQQPIQSQIISQQPPHLPTPNTSFGQSTMSYTTGPVHHPPPHGHHYAHSSGGESADAVSVHSLGHQQQPQPQQRHATAGGYYAPSNGTLSQGSIPMTYAPVPPPPSAYNTSGPPPSVYNGGGPPPSAYAPPSTYGGGGGGPQTIYNGGGGPPPPGPSTFGSGGRANTAGKIALGALAAGAVAYGVHELVEQHEEGEERRRLAIVAARRQQEEAERQRRETEARRRREEEEERRREDHERWRREEDERHRQDAVYGQQQQPSSRPASAAIPFYPSRPRADSMSSRGSATGTEGGVFRPPAPFGRPAYSFHPDDVRFVDPSRSSHASATPETYPELRQAPSDSVIKIGTIIALKHLPSGRFLRSDRSHSTASGSNQQLVYASRWNPAADDWWQVLPANQEVPVPGSIVSYGTQIRLRHVNTGRHLHSHYGFAEG
ncbi:hypothetical protein IWW38_004569, partial [Coemansia aciculifera]